MRRTPGSVDPEHVGAVTPERCSTGFSLRRIAGFTLLAVSCLAFAVLPVVPFLELTPVRRASIGGGLFLFAEITWWAAIPLLGKEIVDLARNWWARLRERD